MSLKVMNTQLKYEEGEREESDILSFRRVYHSHEIGSQQRLACAGMTNYRKVKTSV
jgi:hypothetical protein